MEKTSYQEKEVSTSNTKRGQYSPRRKDTAPKVNPQLAVELIFQEIKRIEAFTKRIEDATQRKVQILCPRPLGRGRKGYSSDYPTRCSQLVS